MEAERAQQGLTALRVGYDQLERDSAGASSESAALLSFRLRGPNLPEESWTFPADAIRSVEGGADADETVEDDLRPCRDRLAATMAVQRLRAGRDPLWLGITSEHPFLPAIDWETGLDSLNLPLARLPGRIGAPTPVPHRPRVAICVSTPVAKVPFDAARLVEGAVSDIESATAPAPEVHVFADARTSPSLRDRLGERAIIHDPEAEGPHERAPADTTPWSFGGQPWLAWIARAMGSSGLDILHLIGHGFAASGDGAFAVAETPERNLDRATARFVWSQQVAQLLAVTGGWGLVVTAAPENFSTPGLRLLASRVAALRAAAVACHDAVLVTPEGPRAAYRLLLSYPALPPVSSRGLTLIMHPERFGVSVAAEPTYRPAPSVLGNLVDGGADVATGLVGARRLIAQWETQLSVSARTEHLDGSREGLELAKSRLDAMLREQGASGAGT